MAVEDRVSFAADIKPLFRERDQRAMTFVFDLWAFEDVKEHAARSAADSGTDRCPAMVPGHRSRSSSSSVGSSPAWASRSAQPVLPARV
jgi:hypothetical protein